MKEADKRRGPINKEKSRSAGPNTRDRKPQEKKASRNLKEKESDVKPSSAKQNSNKDVSELRNGAEPSGAFENVVIDYVDEKQGNGKLSDNMSDMEIVDESDAETTNESVSSHGESQTADEDKTEKVTKVRLNSSGSDGSAKSQRSKSDRKTNNQQIKTLNQTPRRGSEKDIPKLTAKSSSDSLKNMKVHPKPLSVSSEEADAQSLEQVNVAHTVCIDDEVVDTEENDKGEYKAAVDQKIEEMETKIKNLESELREVAALEISLYSVVPEHGSSAHKVHTPARRLSRLYIYACKYWSQDKRATVARNTVSGLVLVSKSCGNDVSRSVSYQLFLVMYWKILNLIYFFFFRLTFWLSNTVALREIISQAFGSSCHSSTLSKVFESSGGETKSSAPKWKNGSGSKQLNKQGLLQFFDDWQETRTFTAALEKVETWIFSRIVESIWWQVFLYAHTDILTL